MLRLEPATEAVLPLLIDWIPDAKSALYWGGPDVGFPLTRETLAGMLHEEGTISPLRPPMRARRLVSVSSVATMPPPGRYAWRV